MGETTRRSWWINVAMLAFASGVWVFNAYKIAVGLRSMGLLDGLSAGMCFLVGPFVLLRWYSDVRRSRD